jgi:N utilization substance protein A
MQLSSVINELVEEKDIDRAELRTIVCEGLLAAYEKKYPDLKLRAHYIEKTGEVVVEHVSIRKARLVNPDAQLGDKVWTPFDGGIGRIEIMRAKQVIAARIRKIECAAIYNEFKSKEGTIIQGVVHKLERGGASVKIHDTLAFLPRSLAIPGEKLIPGYPIRALLKEVLAEPRGDNQLILDRSSERFVVKLFELEFPEVYEKIVEVRRAVRLPGYKSKVAVSSTDKNIDPVGTCIGVGGVRIRPLLKELGGEKIDVLMWSDNLEVLVRGALKPAEINRVEIVEGEGARVWLDDEQRAVAIGKMGQNIALASKLVEIPIRLMESGRASRPAFDDGGLQLDQDDESDNER